MVHLTHDGNTRLLGGMYAFAFIHTHTQLAKYTQRAIQAQINNMTHTGSNKDREQQEGLAYGGNQHTPSLRRLFLHTQGTSIYTWLTEHTAVWSISC